MNTITVILAIVGVFGLMDWFCSAIERHRQMREWRDHDER